MDNPLAKLQIERNAFTRGDWDSFAPHRTQVTQLILNALRSVRKDGSSLCILGAGNGNDFDLSQIAQRYDKITLVDLDQEAIKHCLTQQPSQVAARIELVVGDLSGVLEPLHGINPESLEQLDLAIERVRDADFALLDGLTTYDVVVSTCLLTQMIDSVATAIGPDHPRFVEFALALRDAHLKRLCQLTAPGGMAVLITDFVSSDTLPELFQVADAELPSLLARAINNRNFFMGVNPGVLAQQLVKHSIGGGEVERSLPWRWPMGNRMFAVCAVAMRKNR